MIKDENATDEAKDKARLEGLERRVREDDKAGKSLDYTDVATRHGTTFEFTQAELQAILDKVKGEKAPPTSTQPTAQVTAQPTEPQTGLQLGEQKAGGLVSQGTENGTGAPQKPPVAQNETKPDDRVTALQEKIRMDGELQYEKIFMIWQFCVVGNKAPQIGAEMKKAYGETHQDLVRKVTAAHKHGGGSEQALQELLKGLPIPAKFTKQPTSQVTAPLTDSPKIVPQPTKIDVGTLPNSPPSPQSPNSSTNSPSEAGKPLGELSGEALGEVLGELIGRNLRKERTPLDDFMDKEDRSIRPEDGIWFTLLFSKTDLPEKHELTVTNRQHVGYGCGAVSVFS